MDETTRRLLVVSNADAGSNDDAAVDLARSTWEAAGCDVEVVATSSMDELAQVVADVDDRVLVAAGGDGSIRAIVAALDEAGRCDDVIVGLLPLGTGNDLARGVGIPLDDPEAAARALLDGRERDLDLLVDDDGMIGVNLVHIGIGASASEKAAAMKQGLGPAAYPLGAVAAGASEPGWALRVTVDDEVVVDADDVLHVVIGNGPSMGGGTTAAPDATHHDGRFQVVVSQATGPVARMGYATALQRGEHLERDDVRTVRGTTVVVEGEEHPWNVDGELPPPRSRSRWTLRPGAWTLVVPGT